MHRAGRSYDSRVTISAQDSLVLFALLVGGATLLVLAPITRIPYPILLVLGGLGIGFVPGMPHYELKPEIVLAGFLPPLLYSGAFFTSLRDLKTNARAISLLAVGLVLATMVVVAVVAHEVLDFDWAPASRALKLPVTTAATANL